MCLDWKTRISKCVVASSGMMDWILWWCWRWCWVCGGHGKHYYSRSYPKCLLWLTESMRSVLLGRWHHRHKALFNLTDWISSRITGQDCGGRKRLQRMKLDWNTCRPAVANLMYGVQYKSIIREFTRHVVAIIHTAYFTVKGNSWSETHGDS